jgi:hypothetical protein
MLDLDGRQRHGDGSSGRPPSSELQTCLVRAARERKANRAESFAACDVVHATPLQLQEEEEEAGSPRPHQSLLVLTWPSVPKASCMAASGPAYWRFHSIRLLPVCTFPRESGNLEFVN